MTPNSRFRSEWSTAMARHLVRSGIVGVRSFIVSGRAEPGGIQCRGLLLADSGVKPANSRARSPVVRGLPTPDCLHDQGRIAAPSQFESESQLEPAGMG